ncbi:MAG: NYN domain-containing protein [Deltaproteobacteria bacterium]|jgi:hypothetical protein|nr:NYN domain-containing protein [Deltaproteobacteria bacterium]
MAINDPIHVVWDNSNIWLWASCNLCESKEGKAARYALRLHFSNLHDLVTKGRPIVTRKLAGSVPPECDNLWENAKKLGYDTSLLARVPSTDGMQEQAVDELLHLSIANAVLDNEPPQTLVLLTGDGKITPTGTSFPMQVMRAVKKGWDIEVYAWDKTVNKDFLDIQAQYPKQVNVFTLDGHYSQLTFLVEKDSFLNGSTVHVQKRNSQKLPAR